ncbi:hypothetical protein HanHA300_Chr16g0599321 [Helianthus annuus]|nr:hypothetical protein HanHA300_Chr16g0599321 [Helianthus annuus]KAJ0459508.1 hypothetical protein HanHA89_Chr16g0649771 [Helianthus annuus]
MENISAAQECLAKEKADFEAYKRTEEWNAVATNKQVRSFTKLLSQERKLWNKARARDNDKFYRLHQEIINFKAANAGLEEKEAAVVAAMKEASLARNKIEESARKDLQAKDVALAKVNQRLVEAEARADAEGASAAKAEEDY